MIRAGNGTDLSHRNKKKAKNMRLNKKRLLLEKFKSVTAIKKADPASIAAIRGISETWARTLLNYLNSSSNS